MRSILEKSKVNEQWSAEQAIEFLFSKNNKFTPWQHKEELLQLAKLIENQRPKSILEIGTAGGGTLLLAAMLADPYATIISIDLPHGLYGGGYPEWKISIFENIKRNNQKLTLIRKDSHCVETFQQVKEILKGNYLDYLFIDGDHSYEGAKIDFEMYGSIVKSEGLIAFHDIVPDKSEKPDHFVSLLWDEIKAHYEHFEFVSSWQQSKLGLGVLIKR
jgi:predicted O-methyltransferase YrrM